MKQFWWAVSLLFLSFDVTAQSYGTTTYSHGPDYIYQGIKNAHTLGLPINRISIIAMEDMGNAVQGIYEPSYLGTLTEAQVMEWLDHRLDFIDQAVARTVSEGRTPKLVLCLWNWLGYKGDGVDTDYLLPLNSSLRTKMWVRIMNRYKHNTYIVGYDIVNEPYVKFYKLPLKSRATEYAANGKVLSRYYQHLVNINRSINPNKIVYVEPELGHSSKLKYLTPGFLTWIKNKNVVISIHDYGHTTMPDGYKNTDTNRCYKPSYKKYLDKRIANEIIPYQKRYNLKINIGEFGAVYDSGFVAGCHNQPLLVRDMIEVFKKYKFEMWYHDLARGSVWSPYVSKFGHVDEFNQISLTAQIIKNRMR